MSGAHATIVQRGSGDRKSVLRNCASPERAAIDAWTSRDEQGTNRVAAGVQRAAELGWRVSSRYVDIPIGGGRAAVALRECDAPGDGDVLTVRSQPLTNPDVVRVDVRTDDGRSLVRSYETRFGVDRLVAGQ